MKKLVFFFCFSFLLLMMPAAQAEKYDWAEKSYSFPSIETALVYDIDTSPAELSSDILAKSLSDDYQKKAALPGYLILSPEQVSRKVSLKQAVDLDTMQKNDAAGAAKILAENCGRFVDVYIKTQLQTYEIGSYLVPAHTEWKTKTITDTFTDKDGKVQTIDHMISYPEYIPDRNVSTATVKLRFDVYDAKTGKAVMSREELRTRDDSDDPKGVYNRMLDSFFRDLKRNMNA